MSTSIVQARVQTNCPPLDSWPVNVDHGSWTLPISNVSSSFPFLYNVNLFTFYEFYSKFLIDSAEL